MVVLETQHSTLNKLARKLSIEDLEEILFNLGFEIDSSDGDNLKIDITTERPDLLSTQGLARAIRAYLGMNNKNYEAKKSDYIVNVKDAAKEWPYAIACVVKNLDFDDEKIKEVIRIQEKLSATFLRNRRKGGLGLYPLEKIKFPVIYTSDDPKKIKYRPLEYPDILNGEEILEKHPTGKIYKHIVQGWKNFPIFKDANNIIMSMPPILNSHDAGKIDENTKEVFVEATGTDLKTINIAFNVLVGALIDMGGEAYSVDIKYKDKTLTIPEFREEHRTIEVKKINSVIGIELKPEDIKKLLERMMYGVEKVEKDKLSIIVPSTRSDIWHDIDVIDDIARAYGFNNFETRIKHVESAGETTKSVKLKEELSKILIGMGYQEAFTLMLTSRQDQFDKMNIQELKHIKLGKSVESGVNIIRCWLLPEIIKALQHNRSVEYPHKLFEINYAVIPDEKIDVKCKDILKLCIASCHYNANFTEMKQVLDNIMDVLGINYEINDADHGSFIHGRAGKISVNKKDVAFIGELHPAVLKNWGLEMPAAALEINLTDLFNLSD